MLFHPFRDEAELYPDDEEKCIDLYLKNEDKIKRAQAQLMPFLESVDEAQKLYQENREKEERGIEEVMGAELDPEMEQEAADGDEEEDEEHPDYYHIDTDQVENGGDGEKRRQIFKAMVLPDKDAQVITCLFFHHKVSEPRKTGYRRFHFLCFTIFTGTDGFKTIFPMLKSVD